MLVKSYLSTALVLIASSALTQAKPTTHHSDGCVNSNTDFTQSLGDWVPTVDSTSDTYAITDQGLEMKILRPKEYESSYKADYNKAEALPYNKYTGKGFTVNATSYMQYGTFTAELKSAPAPGTVTAVILIADDGDEIDFEILAGGDKPITSNYFWGKKIVYGVNGEEIAPSGAATYDQFYKYTIDWNEKRIVWKIDGKVIRTKERTATKVGSVYEYPSSSARVQIGLWDGSDQPGTAQWALGPVDWSKQSESINAYVKNIKIECGASSA